MFTARAKVFGLIGNPIEYSLSPLMQGIFSSEMNVDSIYVPLPVKKDLENAIKGAYLLGFKGLNVTIPYKKEVINYLIDIDESAKKIGAVNTLVRVNGGFKGYNTDILGLEKSLKNADISIKNKKVIIFGAGGAAKSVLHLCVNLGAESIILVNRDILKAKKLITKLENKNVDLKAFSLKEFRLGLKNILPYNDYIAFQATNVGMYPNVDECIIEDNEFYEKCLAGVDIIYTPSKTRFMEMFLNKKAINGLDMLLYQGAFAWELWNEVKLSDEVIEKARDRIEERVK